jgi:hypothetical protein
MKGTEPVVSIVDRVGAEQDAFIRRFRMAYLRSVAAERGYINAPDLRETALAEAIALIEFATDPRRATE